MESSKILAESNIWVVEKKKGMPAYPAGKKDFVKILDLE
jgi:hypothetical protein